METLTRPKFTLDDAIRAGQAWGANCGPGAAAAALNLTLEEIRPHLGDFEQKRYTSPSMMFAALRSLGVKHHTRLGGGVTWPQSGLARVQWEGPWTRPGVPIAARYRHTHWVASRVARESIEIFDINCMCVGGWVSVREWADSVVPWLLRECEPKSDGRWYLTHAIEIESRGGGSACP